MTHFSQETDNKAQQTTGYADLHMHTNASDGRPSVSELLNFVRKHRPHLSAIAITDHDTLDASLWAYERNHFYPFDIIPGVEVSAQTGHILALWVTEPIPSQMTLSETVQAIHEAGGLAILAHPVHPFLYCHIKQGIRTLRQPSVLEDIGFDGVEIHNAGIAGTGFNWLARRLARTISLAVTGGSDAHTLGAIGTGETTFAGRSADDLRHALLQQSTQAKGTPWSITDYVGYLKHERKRKAMISSGITNSSTPINP
ncbi:MAG: PHP-associated domain-containing protein [Chloroflexota bacterium]